MSQDIGKIFQKLTKLRSRNFGDFDLHSNDNNLSGPIFQKTYDRFKKITLPSPRLYADLAETIKKRESSRLFSERGVTLSELSNILYYSCGTTKKALDSNFSRRSQASAGARYPLEIYIVNFAVEGLSKFVYHYNIKDNTLEVLWPFEDADNTASEGSLFKAPTNGAACAVLITAQPQRTTSKYGPRGYRYVYFEAGAVAQYMNLVATAQEMSSVIIGGVDDVAVEKVLDIDGEQETFLLSVLLGKK